MTQEYIIENEEFIKKRKLEWQEPLSDELGSFVKACLEDIKPLVTSEDGLRALQIAYAAIESIETHKVINVD
ncbi:hypothetical protein ES705_49000 [subsurface metagenome]